MIGGNTSAMLKKRSNGAYNAIGERVEAWTDYKQLTGWLDYASGEANRTYDAKLQQTTHIFICDYVNIDKEATNKRLIHDGKTYDVLLIDDPMGLHQHLEIYLKYVGV